MAYYKAVLERSVEMKKNFFEEPKIEVLVFDSEDVITTSGGDRPILPDDNWE